ncbi:MAG: ROK family protein [Acidimicrobiales bacterium]|nr:ROK family protein [Acidimicrobiales bacterium]
MTITAALYLLRGENKLPKLTVGVDIGGTKIETALVDEQGRIVASRRTDSGFGLDVDGWVAGLGRSVAELQGSAVGSEIGAIGLGFAGQIDAENGVVRESPNVGWSNVPIREKLEAALNIPAIVANDVQAATFGEWKRGAGRGIPHMVCMFVGTGIGGGLVLDGRLYRGATGNAGELGHIIIDINGPPCHCGTHGCLEAHAGGWAIALRAQEAVARDPVADGALTAVARRLHGTITAATVSEAAHQGDPLALRLVDEIGEFLVAGATSVVNAFNPRMVVLGGGVVEGLPELVGTVETGVRRQALDAATASLDIVKAELGGFAGVVGAALLARELLDGGG